MTLTFKFSAFLKLQSLAASASVLNVFMTIAYNTFPTLSFRLELDLNWIFFRWYAAVRDATKLSFLLHESYYDHLLLTLACTSSFHFSFQFFFLTSWNQTFEVSISMRWWSQVDFGIFSNWFFFSSSDVYSIIGARSEFSSVNMKTRRASISGEVHLVSLTDPVMK